MICANSFDGVSFGGPPDPEDLSRRISRGEMRARMEAMEELSHAPETTWIDIKTDVLAALLDDDSDIRMAAVGLFLHAPESVCDRLGL